MREREREIEVGTTKSEVNVGVGSRFVCLFVREDDKRQNIERIDIMLFFFLFREDLI